MPIRVLLGCATLTLEYKHYHQPNVWSRNPIQSVTQRISPKWQVTQKILDCIVRESNPGRPRGRRAFYHWTNDAVIAETLPEKPDTRPKPCPPERQMMKTNTHGQQDGQRRNGGNQRAVLNARVNELVWEHWPISSFHPFWPKFDVWNKSAMLKAISSASYSSILKILDGSSAAGISAGARTGTSCGMQKINSFLHISGRPYFWQGLYSKSIRRTQGQNVHGSVFVKHLKLHNIPLTEN